MQEDLVRQYWAEHVILTINAAFPHAEYEHWHLCERLLPHVLHATQFIERYQLISIEAGRVLHETAYYLNDSARYVEAELLYQRALHIREQSLGSDHPEVASTLNGLAVLYNDQGKSVKAEPLYQRALHIREQSLGSDHPEVASTLNGLAILYKEQG